MPFRRFSLGSRESIFRGHVTRVLTREVDKPTVNFEVEFPTSCFTFRRPYARSISGARHKTPNLNLLKVKIVFILVCPPSARVF